MDFLDTILLKKVDLIFLFYLQSINIPEPLNLYK